ncbi:TetR/AcrR family transcriptional regulator [Oryzihumus sp.]|uniref:TetR/AcrR family transcriptional regulator n=1 Tax=Oryzihumus sp. TaxID=1968903 RepID=UPI002EDA1AA3
MSAATARTRGETAPTTAPGDRRAPTQRRSRERVELVLDAAAELVVEQGVGGLSTRAIAARAGVPVASIYQYFTGRDAIVLALVHRDTAEMDARVAEAVTGLQHPDVRSVVEATMRAFVSVYHQRPGFVVIWWRSRTNAAVKDFCREHNRRVAAMLHGFAVEAGLLRPDTPVRDVELAVEVGDRVFELAFEHDLHGEESLIARGVDLVSGYLERFAV